MSREAIVEFVCAGECDEDERPTYMVDGYFDVNGEFVPDSLDEMGSDMNCPECGERGEPTDQSVRVADV